MRSVWSVPFPLHAVVGMPFVVSEMHYNQDVRSCFVEKMIRKPAEIGAAKAAINQVEPKRILTCLSNYESDFLVEFILQLSGNFVVISEDFSDISIDQWVEFYFHEERSRSTEAQNSSADTAFTRPESNSSRRRAASAMPSADASSLLCGGNESRSQAASEPRCLSGSSAKASLMSLKDMPKT
jgi:hypothetical protein